MEWIKISDNKLKIMLSAEDAMRYELDCTLTDHADVMTRAAFREILSDIEEESGFDAREDKIYIQMYPSKQGGCELFVTKIGLLLTQDSTSPEQGPPVPPKKRPPKDMYSYYLFPDVHTLILLCRRLQTQGHALRCTAFLDEWERWWLCVITGFEQKKALPHFLSEYGKQMPQEQARLYLCEHAREITTNAIQQLGRC